ncbi:hypothetical protein [Roseateles sp.]|uniref:hypothetical protein n=1 Tax=Roseateles sp. TaxID=1971397 RepID=UPI00286C8F31|nr:hypothetical protein [Roseateles sp.]
MRHLLGLSSLLSLLIATAACAVDPIKPMHRPKTDAQTLWQQIEAEVGTAACDGPQQCHSIAVGAKACGGPDSYLAWSSKGSDGNKLRSLVEQHAAARRAENLASNMMSDCRLVTDPGASCQAGRCTLNPANRGGSPGSHLAK